MPISDGRNQYLKKNEPKPVDAEWYPVIRQARIMILLFDFQLLADSEKCDK